MTATVSKLLNHVLFYFFLNDSTAVLPLPIVSNRSIAASWSSPSQFTDICDYIKRSSAESGCKKDNRLHFLCERISLLLPLPAKETIHSADGLESMS